MSGVHARIVKAAVRLPPRADAGSTNVLARHGGAVSRPSACAARPTTPSSWPDILVFPRELEEKDRSRQDLSSTPRSATSPVSSPRPQPARASTACRACRRRSCRSSPRRDGPGKEVSRRAIHALSSAPAPSWADQLRRHYRETCRSAPRRPRARRVSPGSVTDSRHGERSANFGTPPRRDRRSPHDLASRAPPCSAEVECCLVGQHSDREGRRAHRGRTHIPSRLDRARYLPSRISTRASPGTRSRCRRFASASHLGGPRPALRAAGRSGAAPARRFRIHHDARAPCPQAAAERARARQCLRAASVLPRTASSLSSDLPVTVASSLGTLPSTPRTCEAGRDEDSPQELPRAHRRRDGTSPSRGARTWQSPPSNHRWLRRSNRS